MGDNNWCSGKRGQWCPNECGKCVVFEFQYVRGVSGRSGIFVCQRCGEIFSKKELEAYRNGETGD